jgi:5-methylcytosine-specific restriction endonuclease McrA
MQVLFLILFVIAIFVLKQILFELRRKKRREFYRNGYLKSEAWKRKRYVVLKRDNWRCVYCGSRATQVHHTKYAKNNIGKEPIEWLVSICETCHEKQHS